MRSKLLIVVMLLAVVFSSCKNTGNGELIGVSSGNSYTPVDPYGMAYIPMGSFTRGVGDQDISGSNFYQPKTITVSAFYMDETEITNSASPLPDKETKPSLLILATPKAPLLYMPFLNQDTFALFLSPAKPI
mgnify:CR=1 FL=1